MSASPGNDVRVRPGLATTSGRIKFIVGLLVTAGLVWAIAQRVDGAKVLVAVRGLPAWSLGLAAVALVIDFAAKIARWRLMLKPVAPGVTWGTSGGTLLGSLALNNLLPLRAGDAARAFAFRGAIGAGPAVVVPLLVLERLLDTGMLLVLAAGVMIPLSRIGVLPHWLWPVPYLAAAVVAGAPAAVGAFVYLMRRFRHRYQALGLSATAAAALETVEGQLGAVHVLRLVALTAIGWACEAAIFVALAAGLGIPHPLIAGGLACALATLSGLIPSAPGAIGTFHAAAMAAVGLLGVDTDRAAAFAIAAHAFLWLPVTVCGALWLPFVTGRRTLTDAKGAA